MELTLQRFKYTGRSTIGELRVMLGVTLGDMDCHECWTLEDRVRPDGEKVQGETAIPAGRYEVIINYSARFKRPMPLLLDVPDFTGIRIHSGNTDADTEGCILVGTEYNENVITNSRIAFAQLMDLLNQKVHTEKIFLTINN
jgi:hypothetical protein